MVKNTGSSKKAVGVKGASVTTTTASSQAERFYANAYFSISFRQFIALAVLLSVLLLVGSGALWWKTVSSDPQQVFNDMLSRSLSSSSAQRRISQDSSQGSVDQQVLVSFGPEVAAHTKSKLTQADQTGGSNSVTTETIGTKQADYVRYVAVDAPSQADTARSIEKLLGTWGKREKSAERGVSFLDEAIFVIVPAGDLSGSQRQQLLGFIENEEVYKYSKATRSTKDGRLVYEYEIDLQPEKLVKVLAEYARISGLGNQEQLNPESYAGSPPIKITATVDILSRQLTKLSYADSERVEYFFGRNLKRAIAEPADTISVDELQKRLDSGQ